MKQKLIQCPFCKTPIPDDGVYCDVCGKKLRWCSSCSIYAKAKICTKCGNPTEEINPADIKKRAASVTTPGHLDGLSVDLRLGLCHEAIIGRRGSYGAAFQPYQSISGLHAKLLCQDGAWKIEDLGSSFGTFLNGKKLESNQLADIKVGDILKFADMEFKVSE